MSGPCAATSTNSSTAPAKHSCSASGLTCSPATHGAQPIGFRVGDVRDSLDRFKWPISWGHTTPLLQRSVDWRSGLREHSAAERIVDRRHRAWPGVTSGDAIDGNYSVRGAGGRT
jgi:hypothetical protein